MLSFFNEFISTHLHVLVEQVTSENLLSIFVVDQVRAPEEKTQSALGYELQVFVVEENIVVVEEEEL